MKRSELDTHARVLRAAPVSASAAASTSHTSSSGARSLLSRLFQPTSMHASSSDVVQLETGVGALHVCDNAAVSATRNRDSRHRSHTRAKDDHASTERQFEAAPTRLRQHPNTASPRVVLMQGYLTKLPAHKYWSAKVRAVGGVYV